jgi:aspartyl aminopeptidase
MDLKKFNKELFSFLRNCPTPFHTINHLENSFKQAGFIKVFENEDWNLDNGSGYYCIRDDSTIIGMKLAADSFWDKSWRMTTAHSDSPALQLKPNPVRTSNSSYQLCVEIYGGPLLSTWFDRDLSIAGRVTIQCQNGNLHTCTIDFEKPMAIIPSLAIHLDRNANKEHKVEKQKQLYPLICQTTENELSFDELLLQQITTEHPDFKVRTILGFDLFCYDTNPATFVGVNNDFITASRLDNLVSCFVGSKALLTKNTVDNALLLCSNHEEVGSSSVAGAQGNFLSTVLKRLMPDPVLQSRLLSNSYLISMDNAHAVHPNFPEKHDPQHCPMLNQGPVIKYNSNQRYATTSRSAAMYKILAEELKVPVQEFVMNNDLTCGSTIGPIAATKLGTQTVDIGIPSLAMHSIRETTGSQDPYMLYQTISHFYTRSSLPQTIS